ncbi:hypothetical protein [Streptomyces sp. NPDC050534]|uniref:hypothetical protein n=1 Tax=Streptomyces sp. NPDC050534 TaxID=3365625 RepID=UPI0037B6036D
MTLTSQVPFQAAETDPAERACAGIRSVQQRLLTSLRPKVAMLTELELGPDARDAAHATLAAYCNGPVRRHLAAADQVLYGPVAGSPETRLLVQALRIAATALDGDIEALGRTDDAHRARAVAQRIETLVVAHLAVERAVLLPALAALPGHELARLAGDFTVLAEPLD